MVLEDNRLVFSYRYEFPADEVQLEVDSTSCKNYLFLLHFQSKYIEFDLEEYNFTKLLYRETVFTGENPL